MDALAMLERLTDPTRVLLADAEQIVEEVKAKLTALEGKLADDADDAEDVAYAAWSLVDELSGVLTELRAELDRA